VLKQASSDYERMQYNTVASAAMKMLNLLESADVHEPRAVQADAGSSVGRHEGAALVAEMVSILLRALYPACPHITHTLWTELGYAAHLGDLLDAPWPEVDEAALVQDEIELMLQINGKLRGALKVPAAADKAAIEAAALAALGDPDLAKFTEGRPVKKVVVVPGRLVNLVA
jgi:leucyl-tRNA synthetase